MDKTNFKFFVIKIISIFFIFYSMLSIIRSIGLLYLTFSDSYFYNFDFELDTNDFGEKMNIYFRYYYYIPYVLGTIIYLFCKKLFKINWGKYIIIGLFVILLFRLIDASFVRPLFGFFENTRINVFILLSTFLIIGIGFYILNKRLSRIIINGSN